MRVYALSRGEYSFYTVAGIFSSLDALEQGKAKLDAIDTYPAWNHPIEYEVDAILAHEVGPTYAVWIWLDTGEIYNMWDDRPVSLRHPQTCDVAIYPDGLGGDRRSCPVCRVTSPISIEHAVKVANEKREEWLRAQDARLSTM